MTSIPTSPVTPRTLRLQRGQALHAAFDAGTVLQVTAGTVVLREPIRWLADTVVAPVRRLEEGQCHALAQGGCVLEAVAADVELQAHRPAARWQALRRLWALASGRARRAAGMAYAGTVTNREEPHEENDLSACCHLGRSHLPCHCTGVRQYQRGRRRGAQGATAAAL
ncbi:hypothetical protein [Variovorax guangxiensis]|uniref:hypothetical protein n=1 Tax=Variovorax guangxiensis TaxID=1775474 RepID=UPI001F4F7E7C|nr:hypothetical protein [Variovorax guangxiensis]